MTQARAIDGVEQGGGRWCILRTGGARTLALAASLTEAGYAVWTPVRTERRRVPRSRQMREVVVPIMPTFVFARAADLDALQRCIRMPGLGHPAFSIFRYGGRVPLLSDRALEGLRSKEQRERPKAARKTFALHSRVRVAESVLFGGMSGIVETSDGRVTLVCFGGRMSVKIETFLLREDGVEDAPPA